MLPPRDTSQLQRQIQTQSERVENNISKNHIQRKEGATVLITDEIDFKIKKVKKNTEEHFIRIKRIMHQEDITLN